MSGIRISRLDRICEDRAECHCAADLLKIYGLAGLRIGYGITTPEMTNYLNRSVRPSTPTVWRNVRRWQRWMMRPTWPRVDRSTMRKWITYGQACSDLGLRRCRAKRIFSISMWDGMGVSCFDALLRKGIIVRHIDGSMLRVTIGLPEENQLFLSALQDVLGASR